MAEWGCLGARVLGVSVSDSLKGQDGASAAIRERVLSAVKALNYRPNSFAQGLKQDRSLTAGVAGPAPPACGRYRAGPSGPRVDISPPGCGCRSRMTPLDNSIRNSLQPYIGFC